MDFLKCTIVKDDIVLCCVVLYINHSKYSPVKQNYFCYKNNAQYCIYKTSLHVPPDRMALRVTTCSKFM